MNYIPEGTPPKRVRPHYKALFTEAVIYLEAFEKLTGISRKDVQAHADPSDDSKYTYKTFEEYEEEVGCTCELEDKIEELESIIETGVRESVDEAIEKKIDKLEIGKVIRKDKAENEKLKEENEKLKLLLMPMNDWQEENGKCCYAFDVYEREAQGLHSCRTMCRLTKELSVGIHNKFCCGREPRYDITMDCIYEHLKMDEKYARNFWPFFTIIKSKMEKIEELEADVERLEQDIVAYENTETDDIQEIAELQKTLRLGVAERESIGMGQCKEIEKLEEENKKLQKKMKEILIGMCPEKARWEVQNMDHLFQVEICRKQGHKIEELKAEIAKLKAQRKERRLDHNAGIETGLGAVWPSDSDDE